MKSGIDELLVEFAKTTSKPKGFWLKKMYLLARIT